ncbi:hypothetical protein HPMBJEAJ_00138 [Aeromonas phage avDM6]|nr:hypothetical protein HPMBJEAJ_00138 [Aeromonas phage avDM6]
MTFDNDVFVNLYKKESSLIHGWRNFIISSSIILIMAIILIANGVLYPYTFLFAAATIYSLVDLIMYRQFGKLREIQFGPKYSHPYLLKMMKSKSLDSNNINNMDNSEIKSLANRSMVILTLVDIISVFLIASGIHYVINLF